MFERGTVQNSSSIACHMTPSLALAVSAHPATNYPDRETSIPYIWHSVRRGNEFELYPILSGGHIFVQPPPPPLPLLFNRWTIPWTLTRLKEKCGWNAPSRTDSFFYCLCTSRHTTSRRIISHYVKQRNVITPLRVGRYRNEN